MEDTVNFLLIKQCSCGLFRAIKRKLEVGGERSAQATSLLIYADSLQRFVAVILGSSTGEISPSFFFVYIVRIFFFNHPSGKELKENICKVGQIKASKISWTNLLFILFKLKIVLPCFPDYKAHLIWAAPTILTIVL